MRAYLWSCPATIEAPRDKSSHQHLKIQESNTYPRKKTQNWDKKNRKINSPALTPEVAAALLRPFFLMMKLAPMNPLDSKARTTPFRLSSAKPMSNLRLSFLFFFFSSSKSSNHKLFQIIPRMQGVNILCFSVWSGGYIYGVNMFTTDLFVSDLMWQFNDSTHVVRSLSGKLLIYDCDHQSPYVFGATCEVIYDVASIINTFVLYC